MNVTLIVEDMGKCIEQLVTSLCLSQCLVVRNKKLLLRSLNFVLTNGELNNSQVSDFLVFGYSSMGVGRTGEVR